jgi:hypothetical protein
MQGPGFRVQGSEFRVQGPGFGINLEPESDHGKGGAHNVDKCNLAIGFRV